MDSTQFRFGCINHPWGRFLDLHLPIAEDIVVTFEEYVVSLEVLLLGLDELRKLKMKVNFENDTLLRA